MVSAPTQAIEMVLKLHDAVHTSYISELLLSISFCDNKLSTEHSLKSTTAVGWWTCVQWHLHNALSYK